MRTLLGVTCTDTHTSQRTRLSVINAQRCYAASMLPIATRSHAAHATPPCHREGAGTDMAGEHSLSQYTIHASLMSHTHTHTHTLTSTSSSSLMYSSASSKDMLRGSSRPTLMSLPALHGHMKHTHTHDTHAHKPWSAHQLVTLRGEVCTSLYGKFVRGPCLCVCVCVCVSQRSVTHALMFVSCLVLHTLILRSPDLACCPTHCPSYT